MTSQSETLPSTAPPYMRRNFIGGLWHGAFLAFGYSMTSPDMVIAALVANLTGSTLWVGGLSTVLGVAATLPQVFVARWIEPRPRKMPYLMLAIYLRTASWAVLAYLIYAIGAEKPMTLAWALVIVLAVFFAGGGIGGIPYTDIIGKVIPPQRRGAFFGGRQALAAPLSIAGAFLAKDILRTYRYPNNYAMLFGLSALALGIASLGFWMIREPVSDKVTPRRSWAEYRRQVRQAAAQLKTLVGVQLLTGFSLMALPFYVVYATQELGAPTSAVGRFLLVQVTGGVLANLVWARLVDRYGSRRMLAVCATLSTLTPLSAIVLGRWGWRALLPVFFLSGAIVNGRIVGFQSALLELAPPEQRPTYAGVNGLLLLPLAFLPLIAGALLRFVPYWALFALVAAFVALGGWMTRRLPDAHCV